jgi:hypothetical protein
VTAPFRALVTGNRDWSDWKAIETALDDLAAAHPSLLVVHVACPTGADAMADAWVARYRQWPALDHHADVERHPADWRRYGRRAGPVRNAAMVALGADVCLAFVRPCVRLNCPKPGLHGSHGASQCADLAEAAGIVTRRVAA